MEGSSGVGTTPVWPLSPAEEHLLDAAETLAAAIEAGLEAQKDVPLQGVEEASLIATFHAVRALRCLRSVTITCRAGYAVEAAAIVRSLLEDAVSLRYLSLKPKSRVRKWLRFDETRSLEYWRLSERLGLGLLKSEHIRRLEAEPRAASNPVWWSGKNPSAMAREIKTVDPDLHKTFKALYPWLSDVTHANVKTTSSYYFADEGNEPTLRVEPSNHLLHLMIDLTAGVCVRVCLLAQDLDMKIDIGPMAVAKTAFDERSANLGG